jgi:glyoxylate/hydroxypyruvate reductase
MGGPAESGGWKVVMTRRIPPEGMEVLRAVQPPLDLRIWDSDDIMPHDKLLAALTEDGGADALYCMLTDKIDAELIATAGPRLKCISTMSVGFNHIDVAAAKAAGIKIGFTPEVLTDTVADLAIGVALAACRRFKEANAAVTNGEWGTWKPLWMCGRDLYGSNVGIIGFGRIGWAVAKRLTGFGCNISYFDKYANSRADEVGAKQVSMDELLAESDFVIPFCASTPETQGMFNAELFGKMKKTAVFVNVARGEIVHQDDLIEALKSGTIFGAGLDVTSPEPLPLDSELGKLPNCYITPHVASATADTRGAMAALAANNLIAAFQEKPLPKEVK